MPYKDPVLRNEKQREYGRQYRARHLDAVRARDREKKRGFVPPVKGTPEYRRRADLRNAATKKRCAANIEAARAHDRKMSAIWRERHPKEQKEFWRVYRSKHPHRYVAMYGITEADYDALHAAQHGLCAICGEKGRRKLGVDHDHSTGTVRALLCSTCNSGLGHFKDNPTLLTKAAMYLTAHTKVARCS